MKLFLTLFLVTVLVQSSFAIADSLSSKEQLFVDGKRFRWMGKTHKHHFYYDFNGDKVIDAFDVLHPKGIDFYNNRVGGVYYNKYQILQTFKGVEEITYKRNKWHQVSRRKLAQNYENHRHPPKINYSQYLSSTVLKGLLCLGQTSESSYWVQKIFSKIQNIDLASFKTSSEPDQRELFKRMLNLADLDKNRYFDLGVACQQCCMGHNNIACKLCFSKNLSISEKESWKYDLYSLFIYDDSIKAHKRSKEYHSALERVYSRISNPIQIKELVEIFDGNKDKLLETLYFQYAAHMNKNVNSLTNKKLFYSDMIAELMSKVSCFSKDKVSAGIQKKCEVLYLARSIPDSYCFTRQDKNKCRNVVRASYANRKRNDEKGVRIPSNFSRLE